MLSFLYEDWDKTVSAVDTNHASNIEACVVIVLTVAVLLTDLAKRMCSDRHRILSPR